jgi:uncharacterized protein (DUF488 family)
VRSVAGSRYNPQFNKEVLAAFLNSHGIAYLHFAEAFGARHAKPVLLDEEGRVDFEKVRGSEAFKKAVGRLRSGVEKGFVITLMCAESEPFDCHRFSMVSLGLVRAGFDVRHILKDKALVSQEGLEERLLKKYEKKIPLPGLFQPEISPEDRLKAAYRLRNKEIGYSGLGKERDGE